VNSEIGNSGIGLYSCVLEDTRFEVIGECCIKLLPESLTWRTQIHGFGMSWSPTDYSKAGQGWVNPMPPSLVPEPQQYAVVLGQVRDCRILGEHHGGARISPHQPKGKMAWIQKLWGVNDLSGFKDMRYVDIIERDYDVIDHLSVQSLLYNDIRTHTRNPIVSGQLLNTNHASWKVENGTLEIAKSYPPLPRSVEQLYGEHPPTVFKFTPNGKGEPRVIIPFLNRGPGSKYKGTMNVQALVVNEQGHQVRFHLRYRDLRDAEGNIYSKYSTDGYTQWHEVVMQGSKAPDKADAAYWDLRMIFMKSATSYYFLTPIVSEDLLRPYSPYMHPNLHDDFEITSNTSGVILRSPDGSRWRIRVDNSGNLSTKKL
jgi:hypothetical protein